MTFIYLGLLILVFIIFMYNVNKNQKAYRKNLSRYMKMDLEDYFEARYLRLEYLFYIIGAFIISSYLIHASLALDVPYSFKEAAIFSVVIIIIALYYYLKAAGTKIVYDHGQVTYYMFGKKRVSGSIYDVDEKRTYAYAVVKNSNSGKLSCIMFSDGSKILFDRENMDHAYKFEALMRKRGLFEDPGVLRVEELRKEYGDRESLDDLEKVMRTYDKDYEEK